MAERNEPIGDEHLFAPAVAFFGLLTALGLGAGWAAQVLMAAG
jgi:hypothetical protein